MARSKSLSPVEKPSPSKTFEVDARALLARLMAAVTRLIKSHGREIPRATDLQHALQIRAPLAWQVFRWANAGDALATVAFIPKPEAMAKVLAASRKAGFDRHAIAEVERLYAQLGQFIQIHAGDRGAFDAMIASLGHSSSSQIEYKHRRAAYRANSQLWGLSARALYSACIYHPNGPGMSYGSVVLKGLVELRALRTFSSIPLSKRYMNVQQGGSVSVPVSEFMIFEDFCSDMGRGIQSVHYENEIRDSLQLRDVGRSSRATVFIGVCVRALPLNDPDDRTLGVGCTIQAPCEDIILDLLTPIDRSTPAPPVVFTTGAIDDPMKAVNRSGNPEFRMPGNEGGAYLGTEFEALRCPELPTCPELVRAAVRRVGWETDQFNLYRARISFPVLHTHVSLETTTINEA